MRLSLEEFTQRFTRVDITPDDIQRAMRIGLVEFDGAKLSVPNEVLVDLGAAGGTGRERRLGEPRRPRGPHHRRERYRRALPQGPFHRHFWEPYAAGGMPTEEMNSLTAAVNQLTELATSVVTAELHDRFAAFADQYLLLTDVSTLLAVRPVSQPLPCQSSAYIQRHKQ